MSEPREVVRDAVEDNLIPELALIVIGYLEKGVKYIFSSNGAFAALMKDGSVVTWGLGDWGGDSSSVQAELKQGVVNIFPTHGAFAALKRNGSVITWGGADCGGDSSSVQEELEQGIDVVLMKKKI